MLVSIFRYRLLNLYWKFGSLKEDRFFLKNMVAKNKKKTVRHKNNMPVAIVVESFLESSEANAIMLN
jgi:hypothetical protein